MQLLLALYLLSCRIQSRYHDLAQIKGRRYFSYHEATANGIKLSRGRRSRVARLVRKDKYLINNLIKTNRKTKP